MSRPVKVIDLFAGPGGLGEGFSAYRPKSNTQAFRIALSIEKEDCAHRTLQLRALFRQFNTATVPECYYAYLRGELGKYPEDQLYKLPEIQDALAAARLEAQKLTLGENSHKEVYGKIRAALDGDECVLIGGPPCQAYSLVGRSRNYGARDKVYSASKDHRNFLYREYLRILAKFQPLVFVMENVKGMLSAKVDGQRIFPSIRSDLQDPCASTKVQPDSKRRKHQYRIYSFVPKNKTLSLFDDERVNCEDMLEPRDFVIRSENYGIPQARHRVILLGIRDDIAADLDHFRPLRTIVPTPTVQDVIADLPPIRSKVSKANDSVEIWRTTIKNINKRTINQLGKDKNVPPIVFKAFVEYIRNSNLSPESHGQDKGMVKKNISGEISDELKNWYTDDRLDRYVTNHEARGHIPGDLHRYLYYSTYAQIVGTSPNSHNLPKVLWPEHKNFESGKFADRFRVQLANQPGTTVTSHISKDGNYFIHYDPSQCRSLTVREAARIQTFPDNYYFVGNRTQQYVQVGNAVPPYLARQLADIVHAIIN